MNHFQPSTVYASAITAPAAMVPVDAATAASSATIISSVSGCAPSTSLNPAAPGKRVMSLCAERELPPGTSIAACASPSVDAAPASACFSSAGLLSD